MRELRWISYFHYFFRVLHFWIKWDEIYYPRHEGITSYILIALYVCLWRDNSAFSFYGRTGLRVVVTSVCDGARVRHRRPTRPGSALSDSRIFTDRAHHGGCRAGSVTKGRPGLEWYLFTSTIRIRPNFNLTVKIVFLPTPQCFSLEARFPNKQ
jgi:hypothetical protein